MLKEIFENSKEKLQNILSDNSKIIKAGSLILIILIIIVFRISTSNQDRIVLEDSSGSAEKLIETNMYVDISGEVNHPGVYQFESGTRLYEVIDKAGGLTSFADKNGINQAEFIEDGEKIIIPALNNTNSSENGEYAESTYLSNELININIASKSELMKITGVGEVIADRIIEYRSTNRFKSIEDIKNIKGVGNATYEKMKSEITV